METITNPESYNRAFEDLMNNKDDATKLVNFFSWRINQFKLSDKVPPDELLNEAYERGYTYICKGKKITHLKAFLKSTGFNYLREISRRQQRNPLVEENSQVFKKNSAEADDEGSIQERPTQEEIIEVLELLKDELGGQEGVDLIKMRYFDQLSWGEIKAKIQEKGEDINQDALRKRLSRVLKKIRKCDKLMNTILGTYYKYIKGEE